MQNVALTDENYRQALAVHARRLEKERLHFYEPYDKQLQYHMSQKPIRCFRGGNKTGKSYAQIVDLLWTVGRVHPYRKNYEGPVYTRLCCVDDKVLHNTILPLILQLCPRGKTRLNGRTSEDKQRLWCGLKGGTWDKAWSEKFLTLRFADGSLIEMKTYAMEPMAYEGPVRHYVGHDEPPPRWALTANMSRQITVGTNMSFALTPIGYENWLYTLLENDSQGRCFSIRADIEDNPYIPRDADGSIGVAKDIENAPIDEAEKAARLHGEWTSIAGRIWKEYGDHNFVDVRDVPREYTRSLVVDSHPDKDDYVNLIAWDETNRRMFVMAEGRFPGMIKDRCLSIRQFAQGECIDLMPFDPSVQQKTSSLSERSRYDIYRQYFPMLRLANNSRQALDLGREAVRDLSRKRPDGTTGLYVFHSCPITHRQCQNYSWKPPKRTGEDRKWPEVVKADEDHAQNLVYSAQFIGFESYASKIESFDVGLYANA